MFRSLILLMVFTAQVVSSHGQNLFRLKEKKYWSEELVWSDSASIAIEEFEYNEPSEIDEEYSHVVFIKFLVSPSDLVGRRVRLPKDSALVTIRYQMSSVWFWRDPQPVTAKGELRVLGASAHGIQLDHDLAFTATYPDRQKFRLAGSRTIRRGYSWRLGKRN